MRAIRLMSPCSKDVCNKMCAPKDKLGQDKLCSRYRGKQVILLRFAAGVKRR